MFVRLLIPLFILLLAGCGRIEKDVQDGTTIEPDLPQAANCVGTDENAYGCYGAETVLFGKKIVKGVWSVYEQSNIENVNHNIFYDRYKRGYDFREDGTAFTRTMRETADFSVPYQWGVSDDGKTLNVEDGNSYVYQGIFANDSNCFEVTRDTTTVKLCNESLVDMTHENEMGYYGADVAFGNLTHYNLKGVGTWKIAPYDSSNGGSETTVTLTEDGNTSNGGHWGVSADGKVMGIDGIRYLVYQYLDPYSDQCIAVFELSDGRITSTTWKLCKQ